MTAPATPATSPATPAASGDPTVAAPTRAAIVTLGCGRNEVDSDQLAGLLVLDGMIVVDDPEAADVVLVNTCTFIAPAKQESIDTVLAACALKDGTGVKAVLVVGCMAERYGAELAESIPEADAVLGFDAYPRLPQIMRDVLAGRGAPKPTAKPAPTLVGASAIVRRDLPLLVMPSAQPPPEAPPIERVTTSQDELDRMPASGPRFPVRRFDGRPWAYLKIASGCDRVCTFCAIPSFRGRFRSRAIDELVAEASFLVDGGARELVCVSENTTSYGKDLGGRDQQVRLLEELSGIPGLERIRLMYLQPAELQRPLLEAMTSLPKVAPYFDLSLQHVSASVLERMARSGSPERFRDLVGSIRELAPEAVFRSNFIVGFPGETEDDVADIASFLEDVELDWVGFFPFSVEDGTPSATMPDQIPEHVAMQRLNDLSELQETIADDLSRGFIGRRLDVTVEEVIAGEICAGRSYREAPETDGEVRLVTRDGQPLDLPLGRTVTAEVIQADGVDLIAVPDLPSDFPGTSAGNLTGASA